MTGQSTDAGLSKRIRRLSLDALKRGQLSQADWCEIDDILLDRRPLDAEAMLNSRTTDEPVYALIPGPRGSDDG